MKRNTALLPDLAGFLCLAIFFSLLFLSGERMLIDGDTLWHIKAGQEMVERGSILTVDTFSHTHTGQPWTAHEWGAEILMALTHEAAGLAGVVAMYSLVVALAFLFLFRAAERFAPGWVAIATSALAFLFAQSHLLARPHLFSWLFGVLALAILIEGGRKLYILPLLTLVWANIHGGFILGLALQGIFLSGLILDNWPGLDRAGWLHRLRDLKRPLFVLLLSVLSSAVNPFGFSLLTFLLSVTSPVFSSGIGEWLSPNFQSDWKYRFFLLFFILLATLKHTRFTWTDRLLILFVVNASLVHRRHISIAVMLLVPLLARVIMENLKHFPFRRRKAKEEREIALSPVSGPAAAALAALLLITTGPKLVPSWELLSERLFPLPDMYSREVVDYLRDNPPEGKMFNEYSWGDFLIYATELKVFIDGRADMYGEELFREYKKVSRMDKEAEDLLERHGVDWVLFPTDAVLTRYLKVTGEWEEVYRDDQVSVLVRTSPIGG